MNILTDNETKHFKVLMAEDEREQPASRHWQPVIIYITKPCQIEDILRSIKLMIRLIPQHRGHPGGPGGKE